jgi:hypothetical protein
MVRPGEVINRQILLKARTDISEFFKYACVNLTHFNYEGYGCEKNAVVSVCEEIFGFDGKVICEIGDFFYHSKCTQCGLRNMSDRES